MLNAVLSEARTGSATDLFTYSGAVSANIIAATGESLRARLESLNVSSQRARRVFSSFVELAYNIIHHGEPEGERDARIVRCGSIALWQSESAYHLRARSLVSQHKAPLLAERLSGLSELSAEQIRFEFRLRLTNLQYLDHDSASVGAGLGLLTIARNASRPIEYTLEPIHPDADMLRLQIHTVI